MVCYIHLHTQTHTQGIEGFMLNFRTKSSYSHILIQEAFHVQMRYLNHHIILHWENTIPLMRQTRSLKENTGTCFSKHSDHLRFRKKQTETANKPKHISLSLHIGPGQVENEESVILLSCPWCLLLFQTLCRLFTSCLALVSGQSHRS